MGEYFLGVALTVLLGGLVLSLVPDASAKPYLRLICGAAVVLSILLPITSFVTEISEGNGFDELLAFFEEDGSADQNYAEIYNKAILDTGAQHASNELKNEMLQAFGADEGDFDITIVAQNDGDEICISRVEVIIHLSGLAIDPRELEKYVIDKLGCECVVIYG